MVFRRMSELLEFVLLYELSMVVDCCWWMILLKRLGGEEDGVIVGVDKSLLEV